MFTHFLNTEPLESFGGHHVSGTGYGDDVRTAFLKSNYQHLWFIQVDSAAPFFTLVDSSADFVFLV